MSVGVNLLFKILEKAAQILPDGYDVEISESHHKFKKDAPSGTALHLLDIVKKNSPHHANAKQACSREGIIGERNPDEIGMQVLRGGDIVGEHTVYFVGMGERIELSHRATSRDNFAMGAVRAAEYIAGKNAGLYSIEDVVGLK
jgi:4-hydroxy-tetrahydrodipicolinate reductase